MTNNLKVGTLVMLIRDDTPRPDHPPIGAIGEVMSTSSVELEIGEVGVLFQKHPSKAKSRGWRLKASWLIPINDGQLETKYLNEPSPYDVEQTEDCPSRYDRIYS